MAKELTLFIFCFLFSITSFANEFGNGSSQNDSSESSSNANPGTAQTNACTPTEVQENQAILNECNSKWSSWGIDPAPPASELRDPNNCSGIVSIGTLQGCGDAIIALPIFMAELGARAMLATLPTDKNTLAYVSQHGSQEEINAFLANEFLEETCGISQATEATYIDLKCSHSTDTNAHLNPAAHRTCVAEGNAEIAAAATCRRSPETRAKYRSVRADIRARGLAIKAAQDERRRIEEEFESSLASIKNDCRVYMNPLHGSMLKYLAPFTYLAKEMQNIAAPRASEVQEFNDCVETKTRGNLELRQALEKQSTGLMAQIAGSFSALKCYNERERKQLMCEVAIGVMTGGAGISAALARKLGPRALEGARRFTGRGRDIISAAPVTAATDGAVDAARVAIQTGGDSLENRTALANAVLEKEGLPPLTAAQAEDVYAAHRLPDDQIAQKARLMSDLDPEQRAALIRGREDLNGRGVAGGYQATAQSTDDMVREAVGAAQPNSNINNDMGLANVVRDINRDGNYGRSNPSPHTGAYWQRNPEVRSDVAANMRQHLDSGGVVSNSQQRDEMLRILALETRSSAAGGRVPDYESLAKYYERAGRPVDDSFVGYLTQGITAGRSHSRFILESQIAESQMAIHRLTQQMRYYSDEMRARGLDLTPAQGRARATEIKSQIDAIERNMQIRQRLIDTGQVLDNVY